MSTRRAGVTLARTGLRISEALALDDTDPQVFDFDARRLRVLRQLGRRGTIGTPKSGCGRDVDLSTDVVTVLKSAIVDKKRRSSRAASPSCRLDVLHQQGDAAVAPQRPPREGEAPRRRRPPPLRPAQLPAHLRVTPHRERRQALLAAGAARALRRPAHQHIYGSAFKLRDLAAADDQDTRSRVLVTSVVTKTENAS